MITLIHEIAHLSNFNKHKNSVKPHGEEWKLHYKLLMNQFLIPDIFPPDIILALREYMSNPAASSCSDINLLRVLKQYDNHKNTILLEDITTGSTFSYNDNRYFIKGEQVRKRFKCKEISSNRLYLFNPLTEVTLITTPKISEKF